MATKMQTIAPASLKSLPERVEYVKAFLDFGSTDVAYLHAAAPLVKPLIPTVVDLVYVKLLSFDITAKAFIPRQTGFSGNISADRKVTDLDANDEQIKFRKTFLVKYLARLVEMDYSMASFEYLDKVAVMHTGQAGFAHRAGKPSLRVELIHMSLLLSYVVDILLETVIKHPDLDNDTKAGVLRALNKVVWIQNDLFARHYVVDEDSNISPQRFGSNYSGNAFIKEKLLPGAAIAVVLGILGYCRAVGRL